MNCPNCNSSNKSHVVDTRRHPDSVRRRRECPDCGHRFTTHEIAASELEKLQRWERLKELREAYAGDLVNLVTTAVDDLYALKARPQLSLASKAVMTALRQVVRG